MSYRLSIMERAFKEQKQPHGLCWLACNETKTPTRSQLGRCHPPTHGGTPSQAARTAPAARRTWRPQCAALLLKCAALASPVRRTAPASAPPVRRTSAQVRRTDDRSAVSCHRTALEARPHCADEAPHCAGLGARTAPCAHPVRRRASRRATRISHRAVLILPASAAARTSCGPDDDGSDGDRGCGADEQRRRTRADEAWTLRMRHRVPCAAHDGQHTHERLVAAQRHRPKREVRAARAARAGAT